MGTNFWKILHGILEFPYSFESLRKSILNPIEAGQPHWNSTGDELASEIDTSCKLKVENRLPKELWTVATVRHIEPQGAKKDGEDVKDEGRFCVIISLYVCMPWNILFEDFFILILFTFSAYFFLLSSCFKAFLFSEHHRLSRSHATRCWSSQRFVLRISSHRIPSYHVYPSA